MNDYKSFEELKGKTLTEVTVNEHNDEIVFKCTDGSKYQMYHFQDCCESVNIEDICGDLQNLIGHEILEAYESTSTTDPAPYNNPESYTWTYYRIRTMYDTVVIRWFGESNGYYSESVDFVCIKAAEAESTIVKYLRAVDTNTAARKQVQDWFNEQTRQGHLCTMGQAPAWYDYEQSLAEMTNAQYDMLPELRKLVNYQ